MSFTMLAKLNLLYLTHLQAGFDVFNALTLMDNVEFIQDLKVCLLNDFLSLLTYNLPTFFAQFGSGDGLLNFYLYNWRTAPVAGVNAVGDVKAGKGVGVAML